MNQFENSPWGKVELETKVQDGVYFVSTPSHGGFLVHKSVKLSDAALSHSEAFGEYYAFEEDCLANIVAYELNLSNGRITMEDVKRGLCYWVPQYVKAIGKNEWFLDFPQRDR